MAIKLPIINHLSNSIKTHFLNYDYGKDVKSIVIITILVKTRKGYEEWYKIRKPKFISHKIIENPSIGLRKEINKEFVTETRYDNELYDTFLKATDKVSKEILAQELLKSLSNLDALPKKVKDFDKERFRADMEAFFKEQNLL